MAAYLEGTLDFTDLEIRIFGRQDDGYPVEITLDRQIDYPRGYFNPQFDELVSIIDPLEIGERLFNWLFEDSELRSAWDQSIGKSPRRRIRLQIDETSPELYALPWEFLVDTRAKSGASRPIAIEADTPFSRYISGSRQPDLPLLELPVKMLVVIASPTNLDEYGLVPLDIQREHELLRQALADYISDAYQITFMERPVTLSALDGELRKGYQILHILSHSAFREGRGGVLFLEDEEGKVKITSDRSLSTLLARQRQLRLVFFAGGHTSERSDDMFGFTYGAVQAGIPLTIGALGDPTIKGYEQFAGSFYRGLLQSGYVDVSCNEARSVMYSRDTDEWGYWSLVSRSLDNQLFDTVLLEQFSAKSVRPPIDLEQSKVAMPSPEEARERKVGTIGGAHNDEMFQEDHLGFDSYVQAFADLISAKETDPPLTIGIFGSWGIGKTFLLKNIIRRIKGSADKYETKVYTVEFNAWEYSVNDEIWPGLVRRIMEVLERQISWSFFDKPVFRRILRNMKIQIKANRAQIILSSAVVIAIIVVAGWLSRENLAYLWATLGALGIVGFARAVVEIRSVVSEPLSPWIDALFEEGSSYGKPIDYMVQIRSDLEFVQANMDENARVLVLIDDLDRCEPEKAVQVLQAIKLLLNFNKFIVVLGIDARVITRAIEKHYDDLLGPSGASGYEYLDKIVQIPFRIPKPTPEEIEEFINLEMSEPLPPLVDEVVELDEEQLASLGLSEPETTDDVEDLDIEVEDDVQVEEKIKISETEEHVESLAFTYDELEIFQSLSIFIRPNPRHIKRLLNVYRLIRTLARIKNQRFILDNPTATIRWLVMSAQWPYATYGMLRYYVEMLDKKREGKLIEWPPEVTDPENPDDDLMIYLYLKVKGKLDREKLVRLDYDPDLLWQLLNTSEGRLNWDELRVMRQYTINFNPAVESELLYEEFGEIQEEEDPSGNLNEAVPLTH